MAQLAAYLSQAAVAVQRQDGVSLGALLALDAPGAAAAVAACLRDAPRTDLGALASSRVPVPYDEVLALHCQCLAALQQNKAEDAYTASVSALAAFTREFRALDSAWPVPALAALIKSLVATAQRADAVATGAQSGGGHSRLNDAGSQLMKCFPATYLSPVREKKQATLLIVNAAFRVYFRLNTLRLCKNMIASVEKQQSNVLPLEEYDAAQRVCYRYYTGRLAIFDEDYPKAEADLSYAFAVCMAASARGSAPAQRNIRRILRYLVPVKLLRGRLPRPQLLAAAGPELALYGDIASALRRGDVRALNAALESGLATLVRQGTYLLLEKLRSAVYRQLLKRVHLIQRDRDPAKAFQLHITLFQRALAMCGVEMDLDECECVLANLIYRKYVKGYISHKARTLVLSKQQPFPPLNSITFDDQQA